VTTRWLMGDGLAAELLRLRDAAKVSEFNAGMARFDQVLDDLGLGAVSFRKLQTNLRSLSIPDMTPMVISQRDLMLAARILRAIQFDRSRELFITSEDSIGFGYGVLVSPDGDVRFHGRTSRQTRLQNECSFNPGMKPKLTPVVPPIPVKVHATRSALEITVSGLSGSGRLKRDFESTVAYRGAGGNLVIDTLHSLNIGLSAFEGGVIIRPNTAEAMIRLASIASSGAIMRLEGDRKIVVRIELAERRDGVLEAYPHSKSGPLGEWLRIPTLPLALKTQSEKPEEVR
jgi:hypothetical protein